MSVTESLNFLRCKILYTKKKTYVSFFLFLLFELVKSEVFLCLIQSNWYRTLIGWSFHSVRPEATTKGHRIGDVKLAFRRPLPQGIVIIIDQERRRRAQRVSGAIRLPFQMLTSSLTWSQRLMPSLSESPRVELQWEDSECLLPQPSFAGGFLRRVVPMKILVGGSSSSWAIARLFETPQEGWGGYYLV